MKKDNLEMLKFSDINTKSQYITKNLIVSNNDNDSLEEYFSFQHPFTMEGIAFGICMKGEAKVKVDFKEYKIERNTVVTILPKHILESYEQSEDFLINFLVFSGEFIRDMPYPRDIQILKEIAINPILQIQENNINALLHYYSFILETFESRKKSPFLEEMIKGLLYSLIMELATLYQESMQGYSKKKKNRYEELGEQFFLLLFEHYREERSTVYYADKMCISPKHLSSVLKKISGHTINEWIDAAVMMGAKSLLKSTNLTVLQISEELNFPTASYFGRFFKRMTGMTPLEYRNS